MEVTINKSINTYKATFIVFICLLVIFFSPQVSAQNVDNSCNGATIIPTFSNRPTLTDYPEQMQGATVLDAFRMQFRPNGSVCSGWSLKVRANSDFVSSGNTVAAQYVALRFNRVSAGSPSASQIGVTNNLVPLTYTDISLIDNSNAAFTGSTTDHRFDMIIAGGNHLLVPDGTYTSSLTFTLFNQNNEVVSSRIVDASFQINSSSNDYTVLLQNGANVIDMVFNTVANYQNGVSVTKTQGLKVSGSNGYQILIKTNSTNLEGSGTEFIPVSAVNVETTQFTSTSGATITTYTQSLSTSDKLIIDNPVSHKSQKVVEYTVRYFTAPNDSRLFGKTGTFNTIVLFVAIPK